MDNPLQNVFDTVRIPVVEESPDIAGLNSAAGLNDIFGPRYINMVPTTVVDSSTGRSELILTKRKGFSGVMNTLNIDAQMGGSTNYYAVDLIAITALANTFVAAMYDVTNNKVVLLGLNNLTAVVKIGELTGTAVSDYIFLSELNFAGVPYVGIVYHNVDSTNSKGYYAATTSGVFTAASLLEITDVDFPPKKTPAEHIVGPMVQMNDIVYVLTKQKSTIYNSDAGSISSWTANAPPSGNLYPDRGVGLARYKHHIVVFGEDSIEFWNDTGGAPPASPLQRTDQAFIKFGCQGPRLFLVIEDSLYWVSQSSTGTSSLYRMNGYTPEELTTVWSATMLDSGAVTGVGVNIKEMRVFPIQNQMNIVFDAYHTAPLEYLVASDAQTWLNNPLGVGPSGFSTDGVATWNGREYTNLLPVFNTENKQWWFFKHALAYQTFNQAFLPLCAQFNAWTNSQSTQTLALFKSLAGASNQLANQVSPVIMFTTNSANLGQYYDSNFSSSTSNPIACSVGFMTKEFGNEKKKRVHRVKLIQRINSTDDNVSATPVSWFLLYMRDDFTMTPDTAGNKRVFIRQLTRTKDNLRYYFNNLGAGRKWAFCVTNFSTAQWQLKALELDISQSTM